MLVKVVEQIVALTFSGEISDRMTKVRGKTPTFATNTTDDNAITGMILTKVDAFPCSIDWVVRPKMQRPIAMLHVPEISNGFRPHLSIRKCDDMQPIN
jgi:hypothetical protein